MESQIASRGEICPIQELNESLRVNLFFPCCWGFYGPQLLPLPQSWVAAGLASNASIPRLSPGPSQLWMGFDRLALEVQSLAHAVVEA